MKATLDRIPSHLRQYVVKQDYSAYDEIDQAVWRFTLLQTYNQLKLTAHQSYAQGLNQTGIYLDRIPRIEEMDEGLSKFGWGAICVNGFVPPRAFQEFQSLGILPINAAIRRAEHLAYTPTPDIIHEAAGHASIIPDATYAAFLKFFGKLSTLGFSSREDQAVYEAIKHLSYAKEDSATQPEEIEKLMLILEKALDEVTFTSESATLARLLWWTVEFGLVGTPENYKIYGAGILSSVGESMMLHLPKVRKKRLRARCVETDYDVTEQQPQLFVVERFEDLNEILDQVVTDFAFKVGGKLALQRALAAGEVGTIHLNSGLQVIGELTQIIGDPPGFLSFTGPCALATKGRILPDHSCDNFSMPIGPLADGTALSGLTEYDLGRFQYRGPGSSISLNYMSGLHLSGKLERIVTNDQGHLMIMCFTQCRISLGDRELVASQAYHLAVGESVPSAHACPIDHEFWPATQFGTEFFPKKKAYDAASKKLLGLYQDTIAAWEKGIEEALPVFERTADVLEEEYPEHWLLHWNMLEKLTEVDRGIRLASRLKATMLEIEARDYNNVPVSIGLKYLGLA